MNLIQAANLLKEKFPEYTFKITFKQEDNQYYLERSLNHLNQTKTLPPIRLGHIQTTDLSNLSGLSELILENARKIDITNLTAEETLIQVTDKMIDILYEEAQN